MHYYQFNIGDYKSHTEHLSEMEDLAYRRLLDWYYLHETPIPLDITEVSRQIRMRSHTECIATVLQEYFDRTESGWTHGRADKEIAKAGEKSTKASASAKARWGKKDANALPTQSEGNATHNTEHITQDTEHSSVAKATGDESPGKVDQVLDDKGKIFTYGVPMLVNAGSTDKAARSFLGGLAKGHGDAAVVQALRDCIRAKPIDPLTWLAGVLPPKGVAKTKAGKHTGFDKLNYREGVNEDGALA